MPPEPRAPERPRSPSRRGRVVTRAGVVLVALLLAACSSGGGGRPDELTEERATPNAGPPPTLPGGVELVALDPKVVLVGTDLAFGTPLPSQQAAAEGYTADPEVTTAVARRVYQASDGRRLGDALVLVLDGRELFDEDALGAFQRSIVASIGDGPVTTVDLVGRRVLRASTRNRVAVAFRQDDLLTIVRGATDADVELVVTRQLEAIARGDVGSPDPVTPMIAVSGGAAFIPMASVSFEPIPPPEEEPGPEVPTFPGAIGVEGRYGVVAGERRTVVWAFALDLATYPSAEALAPALPALVSARAEGVAPQALEVIDRVVLSVANPDGARSASVFRHQGLVLLVEGDRAAQVDAVVTAWIRALGPG